MNHGGRPHARLARPADVAAISRICTESWPRTYRGLRPEAYIEEIIAEFYDPDRIRAGIGSEEESWTGWVVAEADGEILVAGGGGLTEPGIGELLVLYADVCHRRQGGGTAVLQLVTEHQRDLKAHEQWVSVLPTNELGRAFYRSQGFIERGTRPAYRGEGDSLRMSRLI